MNRRDEIRKLIEDLFSLPPELRLSALASALDEIEDMIREASSDGYDDGFRDAGERS